jgi:phosphatidylglycerol:prolipoprotein diacylglycerol transferase
MVSVLLTAGVVVSLLWIVRRAPAGQQILVVDQAVGVLAACLLGSRVGFVLANSAYFQAHLAEVPQFWLGGLSGLGAVLGGVLVLPLVARLSHTPLRVLADRMLPLLVVLNAAGWLGCWWEGCAYGLPANGAWWGLPARDELGQAALRFPLQPVGALLGLAIPWLVEARLARRRVRGAPPGWQAALSLLGMGLACLGLSFLRADPAGLWYGLRPETWGALGVLAVSVALLVWLAKPAAQRGSA